MIFNYIDTHCNDSYENACNTFVTFIKSQINVWQFLSELRFVINSVIKKALQLQKMQ